MIHGNHVARRPPPTTTTTRDDNNLQRLRPTTTTINYDLDAQRYSTPRRPRSQHEHTGRRAPHHVVCIGDYDDPAITTTTTTMTKSTTTTATFAAPGPDIGRPYIHDRTQPARRPCCGPGWNTLRPQITTHTLPDATTRRSRRRGNRPPRRRPLPAGYRSPSFTAAPDRRADHVVPGWNVCRCSWAAPDDDDGYDAADNFNVAGVRAAAFSPTETPMVMTVTRC